MRATTAAAIALCLACLSACDDMYADPPPNMTASQVPPAPEMTQAERDEAANLEKLGHINGESFVESNGVSARPSDDGAYILSWLGLSCGQFEATVFDFLSLRSNQARSAGIRQVYRLTSLRNGDGYIAIINEKTSMANGQVLTGIEPEVDYFYEVNRFGARFVRQLPETATLDPLSFMQADLPAVCDMLLARQSRVRRQASEDTVTDGPASSASKGAPSSASDSTDSPENPPLGAGEQKPLGLQAEPQNPVAG